MKHKIKPLDIVLEDFFNPFDKDKSADKTPKQMGDTGGLLKLRKETFNINRVEYSKNGSGSYVVLSKTQFAKGEIVEICPMILTGIEAKSVNVLKDYVFEIDKQNNIYGIALGYGSLYSHSKTPNIEYAYNKSNRQMYFMTKRMIQAGEELTIDYGKDYWAERTAMNTMAQQNGQVEENTIQQGDITSQTQVAQTSQPNAQTNPATSGLTLPGLGQQ